MQFQQCALIKYNQGSFKVLVQCVILSLFSIGKENVLLQLVYSALFGNLCVLNNKTFNFDMLKERGPVSSQI